MALVFESASKRNEYQVYLLGRVEGKGGRFVGLTTLPPSCADGSGNTNLLELKGPVQACNGMALPLPEARDCIANNDKVSEWMHEENHKHPKSRYLTGTRVGYLHPGPSEQVTSMLRPAMFV
jgi:hypothetical protein